MKKIVVAITGASGVIYAKLLLNQLLSIREQIESIGIILSENAKIVLKQENINIDDILKDTKVKLYANNDYYAPFASGSSKNWHMAIVPSTMGTLAKIAAGISTDLITRAADVMLKEKRRLILVPREMPFNLIQLRNMVSITESGGIISVACPSFYNTNNKTIDDLALTVSTKVIDLLGLDIKHYRWQE
ncbi:MAG: UbiX family flavin prenyltransferase [Solitalea-like symbiont of Acarus siro]